MAVSIDKRDIKRITGDVHRHLGNRRTAEFVDQLKKMGGASAAVAAPAASAGTSRVVTGPAPGAAEARVEQARQQKNHAQSEEGGDSIDAFQPAQVDAVIYLVAPMISMTMRWITQGCRSFATNGK